MGKSKTEQAIANGYAILVDNPTMRPNDAAKQACIGVGLETSAENLNKVRGKIQSMLKNYLAGKIPAPKLKPDAESTTTSTEEPPPPKDPKAKLVEVTIDPAVPPGDGDGEKKTALPEIDVDTIEMLRSTSFTVDFKPPLHLWYWYDVMRAKGFTGNFETFCAWAADGLFRFLGKRIAVVDMAVFATLTQEQAKLIHVVEPIFTGHDYITDVVVATKPGEVEQAEEGKTKEGGEAETQKPQAAAPKEVPLVEPKTNVNAQPKEKQKTKAPAKAAEKKKEK